MQALHVYTRYTFITEQRPRSRSLARSGGRYEIPDLREIDDAVRQNSAHSSGGCSSGGGAQSAQFWRRVRRALAPRSYLETRCVPSLGAGPSQNGTCLGVGIGSKIRAGKTTACFNFLSVRLDPTLYNVKMSAPSEIMTSFGERTAASNRSSSRIRTFF